MLADATSTTEPPAAPFPPSGPPRGLWRLAMKWMTPPPPRPPRTRMVASSTNIRGKDPAEAA